MMFQIHIFRYLYFDNNYIHKVSWLRADGDFDTLMNYGDEE